MEFPANFGKYALLKKVNTGGMAEIFLSIQSGLAGFEKLIAIKRILPHLSDNKEFVSMFIDEAKLAAQLSHPNIVHIYDFGKLEDSYYIAMEYLAGKNLKEIIKRCHQKKVPLTLQHTVLIIMAACKALDYAHRKRDLNNKLLNIVHRDVSPQNILVSYEGQVKLVDFGIAKAALHSQETRVGVLKGKLSYMSPEQAMGRPLDRRSDIFSLGIVLFELLTNKRLFSGDSELNILEKVKRARVPSPSKINPEISPALEAVVLKALAADRETRYQTAMEMFHDLDKAVDIKEDTDASSTLRYFISHLFADQIGKEAEELRALLENLKGANTEKTIALTMAQFRPDGTLSKVFKGTGESSLYKKGPKFWAVAALMGGLLIISVFLFMLTQQKSSPQSITEQAARQSAEERKTDGAGDASQGATEPAAQTGSLKILANISGGSIYLDGTKLDQSTDTQQALLITGLNPRHEHLVTITKEGYKDWEARFHLVEGQEHLIRPEMKIAYGKLHLASQPPGARIFLNGKMLPYDTTPALVDNLRPGEVYALKLEKDGYSPWQQEITLRDGEELYLDDIKMERLYGRLKIDSDPPGARISLNQKRVGSTTPALLEGLSPGRSYRVSLYKKGFSSWEKQVSVKANDTLYLGRVALQPLYGKVRISSDPAGAHISIDGVELDQKTPAAVNNLLPGKKYRIRVYKEGHAPWEKAVSVKEGAPLALNDIVLERLYGTLTINTIPWSEIYLGDDKLGVTPLAGLRLPAGKNTLKLVNSTVGIDEELTVRIDADRVTNQVIKFEGDLNINALPWAEVYIDGEKKGVTPLAGIKLLSGVHQVRLVNSPLNKDESFKIIIKPNRTTTKIVNFNDG